MQRNCEWCNIPKAQSFHFSDYDLIWLIFSSNDVHISYSNTLVKIFFPNLCFCSMSHPSCLCTLFRILCKVAENTRLYPVITSMFILQRRYDRTRRDRTRVKAAGNLQSNQNKLCLCLVESENLWEAFKNQTVPRKH